MLSVEEALERVLSAARTLPAVVRPACEASGLVLAEDIESDIDSPPHDKSIVDGYAIVASDLASGPAEFAILEEVTAGAVPHRAVTPGTTIRIMTGAPLPEGADAVVMVEQSHMIEGLQTSDQGGLGRVRLDPLKITVGQNIMRRAVSMARGDCVLSAGQRLRAIELGILAEVGRTTVGVIPRARVAVLATGNELVPPEVRPSAGHIRNSNSSLLVAAARSAGADSFDLGIARDEEPSLRALMALGLEADVLLISGGVSAGVLDLVPGVLTSLGVEPVFHKVSVKPGKPLWFGIRRGAESQTLVFGLPGNPVSSLVSFELFVKPAIAQLAGRSPAADECLATLASEHAHRGERPTYQPVELRTVEGVATACPLRWQGSGDLHALTRANGLACFPAGDYRLAAGESIRVLRLS